MMRYGRVTLGPILLVSMLGCGAPSAGDCWNVLQRGHDRLALEQDAGRLASVEAKRARNLIRESLSQCGSNSRGKHLYSGVDGGHDLYLTRLDMAIMANDAELVLKEFRSKIRTESDTPLNWAPYYGDDHVVLAAFFEADDALRVLLEEGADPNNVDEQGLSALHVIGGQTVAAQAIIELLVTAGVDINSRSNRIALTPLELALLTKNVTKAKCLLDLGASVDESNLNTEQSRLLLQIAQEDVEVGFRCESI